MREFIDICIEDGTLRAEEGQSAIVQVYLGTLSNHSLQIGNHSLANRAYILLMGHVRRSRFTIEGSEYVKLPIIRTFNCLFQIQHVCGTLGIRCSSTSPFQLSLARYSFKELALCWGLALGRHDASRHLNYWHQNAQ